MSKNEVANVAKPGVGHAGALSTARSALLMDVEDVRVGSCTCVRHADCMLTVNEIENMANLRAQLLLPLPIEEPTYGKMYSEAMECIIIRKLKYRPMSAEEVMSRVWRHYLKLSPGKQAHCFFIAVMAHVNEEFALECPLGAAKWLRRVAASTLKHEDPPQLSQAPDMMSVSEKTYVRWLHADLWGGQVEAGAIAKALGLFIRCWTPDGSLCYTAGREDSEQVVDIGYYKEHYVALHPSIDGDMSSTVGVLNKNDTRGGMQPMRVFRGYFRTSKRIIFPSPRIRSVQIVKKLNQKKSCFKVSIFNSGIKGIFRDTQQIRSKQQTQKNSGKLVLSSRS